MRSIRKILLLLTKCMLLAIMLLVGISVIARYLLHQPIPWSDQIVGYLLCFMVMFHASELVLRERNINIDLLHRHISGKSRNILDFINKLLLLVVALLILYSGIKSVWFVYEFELYESDYLTLPSWIPRLSILIGGAAMSIAALIRLRLFLGNKADEDSGK
jgi:TRAP-type C4-dicarboxylate transport system permease small subunit